MHTVRRIPKVSIFMAVTTKIVTKKAKKWPKMARFWPKSLYNGRVMAREVFFYQCLKVTKLCAKYGCSWTPRTASIHKYFIVLWCMWKEPAPLIWTLIGKCHNAGLTLFSPIPALLLGKSMRVVGGREWLPNFMYHHWLSAVAPSKMAVDKIVHDVGGPAVASLQNYILTQNELIYYHILTHQIQG